jgi:post-segregation antitoxin (ccd killing protein)
VKQKLHRRPDSSPKQRTTLTLPSESLAQAKRIAQARRVNLSVVISEALSEGLRQHTESAHSEEILNRYKRAFGKFSAEEILLLDGVIFEPAANKH